MMAPNLQLLSGSYLDDLLEQPDALRRTVAALAVTEKLDLIRQDLHNNRYDRIILTGMGGSYQILHPLHVALVEQGYPSLLVETSELLHAMPRLLSTRALVITVSQSGMSAETVKLVEDERSESTLIGITNTADSALATRADLALVTQAGPESAVSCKTAVSAMAALDWLGAFLCDADMEKATGELHLLPEAFASYLNRWQTHVAELMEYLDGVQHAFYVGRGRSLAAAGMGGMIQKEAARVHGEGMSSAAFRHGPFEMLRADVCVIVFEGPEPLAALNRQLVDDVRQAGARGALVGFNTEPQWARLPRAPERLRPILEMLVPQMTTLAFAALKGIPPARFERITKVTTVE